ncbi:phosphate-starvation-inducible protein PsiE [Acidithiobacillus sulfuriphilus]|uniref:Phosphate-starvation-inducible PsiE family protein n=2 Tax=Acidithiobacillus sulfuriphilus TaxID=1867749 RepID=A0ACD5HPE9_9PROT
MKNMPNDSSDLVIRALHWVEWIVLILLAGTTAVAIGQEVVVMVHQRGVMLHNILLFFIYLEVLTMIGLYFQSGKVPLRYPLYIAMVAVARQITIDSMTDMNGWAMTGLATVILILALAVLVIRYGHIHMPYDDG